MSFWQMIAIAGLSGLGGIDLFNMKIHIHRPLVAGAIVGLIMNDLEMGIISGAVFELVWLGAVPVGGAQPPNVVVGGIIGTTFAILTGQEPAAAIGIAMPVAIGMQAAITFLLTAFSGFMHKADKYAEEGDDKGITNINILCLVILFLFYFILTLIPIYFGAEVSEKLVEAMPVWILNGLKISGGLMPAVGFAMLLNIMYRTEYAIYIAVGFILVTFFNLPILPLSVLGVCLAVYNQRVTTVTAGNVPAYNDEFLEEEDYSDGI